MQPERPIPIRVVNFGGVGWLISSSDWKLNGCFYEFDTIHASLVLIMIPTSAQSRECRTFPRAEST